MPQIFPLAFARRFPVRVYTPWPVYTPVRPVVVATRFRPYTTKAVPIVVLPTPKPLCQKYYVYDARVKFFGPFPVVTVVEDDETRYVVYMTADQARFHIHHSHVCGLLPWRGLPISRRRIIHQMCAGKTNFSWNSAPQLANPLVNQSLAAPAVLSYQFAANTFFDADTPWGDTLTYSAKKSDGSALPTWMTFTPATRTFSGTSEAGTTTVRVTATDNYGASVTGDFTVTVTS